MNLLDLEIHAWIRRYLHGRATLNEFEDWFIPATWNVERSGNTPAIEVAGEIRMALAELSAGESSAADVWRLLEGLENQRAERIRFFEAFVAQQHAAPLSDTILVDPT